MHDKISVTVKNCKERTEQTNFNREKSLSFSKEGDKSYATFGDKRHAKREEWRSVSLLSRLYTLFIRMILSTIKVVWSSVVQAIPCGHRLCKACSKKTKR